NRPPDLVLSDVMMPGMDGFALLKRLRADEKTASVPILLLSACAGEEARIEGLGAGADDYLVKPFAARELVARVESAIRLAHVRQDAAEREQKIMAEANRALMQEVEGRKKAQNELSRYMAELKQANRQLDAAFNRLTDIDRLKSMFIASMSHELRTPLNSIIGFSKVLENEWAGPLNSEQKDNLNIISRAGKHLLGLINDVIDVSKIEAGKMDVRIEEFDLADVQRNLYEMMGKEASDRGLTLNIEPFNMKLQGDRQRLSQCLLNLVSNSLKYTEQGTVHVRTRPAGPADGRNGRLHIIVEDTGIGISSKDAENLFSPFVRFNSHLYAKEKGTGLGLYLTKKLATQVLHGDVLYEPRPEGGSR
ncbi:MAG: response regulator, partial [Candidatus Nitrosotenuis sp.]